MDPQVILFDVEAVSVEIQALRRMLPDARIVLLTSMWKADIETLQEEINAHAVLEKPIKLDKLFKLIRSS